MKRICILTATRAEYGLLKNIILKLQKTDEFKVNVVATGMHLSSDFGLTYQEIEQDGIILDKKIDILMSSDSKSAISKTMGLALIQFANYFEESKPDILMVLGDRYETLAVCIAAMNQQIPIVHLYGGETTEGAVDEAIRHAITKLSYLHFTSTEEYRKRVIQLGEAPERVFCVGAMGIENIMSESLMSLKELEESIGFSLDNKYAVVTFHPVTLEDGNEEEQINELFGAFDEILGQEEIFDSLIITKANADTGGRIINKLIDKYAEKHPKQIFSIESLGMRRYLSALKYCTMVIGNSSSGLVEAPSFGIPTINIGDRQKGRIKSDSVFDCHPQKNDIVKTIRYALSMEGQEIVRKSKNPYGDGITSDKIVDDLQKVFEQKDIDLKKKFYDISF
ncbi:MAG: UDP-N-acetylglucosamine 2-epimerase [Lachnospiraceae bacterium]|nr:UDP-N-acetylglucosamine 2-epimerase [Lachnospiraceae bacterium]